MLAQNHRETEALPTMFGASLDRWAEQPAIPVGCVHEAEPIGALDDDDLNNRFRSWRGQSGRRYVFSVFDPSDCPAYCDAVLIAVSIDANGRRRAIAFEDTGSFPEPVMSKWLRAALASRRAEELHVHLLARTPGERRAILEDLRAAP